MDSAVAALKLIDEGRTLETATVRLWAGGDRRSCCSPGALQRARQTAAWLGLPHRFVDGEADFEAAVVAPFVASYLGGETPNPCVSCNPRRLAALVGVVPAKYSLRLDIPSPSKSPSAAACAQSRQLKLSNCHCWNGVNTLMLSIRFIILEALGMPLTNTVTHVQPGGRPLTAAERYELADQAVARNHRVCALSKLRS